jgi:hypothetical protein
MNRSSSDELQLKNPSTLELIFNFPSFFYLTTYYMDILYSIIGPS